MLTSFKYPVPVAFKLRIHNLLSAITYTTLAPVIKTMIFYMCMYLAILYIKSMPRWSYSQLLVVPLKSYLSNSIPQLPITIVMIGSWWYLIYQIKCYKNISESKLWLWKCESKIQILNLHKVVIKWGHFSRCWPFVWGFHRSPVNSPYKGQWHGTLVFSLICAWINDWVNDGEAGDLRRHRTHYDIAVMVSFKTISILSMRIEILCTYASVIVVASALGNDLVLFSTTDTNDNWSLTRSHKVIFDIVMM